MRTSFCRAVGLLVGTLLLVAACGGSTSSGQTDQIDITVTHYPGTFYGLPYMVAMDKGLFAEQHIKIGKVIGSAGGGTTVRNLLSGKLAFGDVATSGAVQAYGSGAPLVMIGGSVQDFNDAYYVTRKDASFTSATDLVGKTWCYTSPGSATNVASLMIFKKLGMNQKSLNFRAAGDIAPGLTLLKQGGCDATVTNLPEYEKQKAEYKTLFNVGQLLPGFQQSVITTSPQMIKQHPDLVKRFLAAYKKGVDWIYANPAEAGKIFAKYAQVDQGDSVASVQELAKTKHWNAAFNLDAMNTVLQGSELAGLTKADTKVDWSGLLDQNFLPAGVNKINPKQLYGASS